jgi:hypothetical protein
VRSLLPRLMLAASAAPREVDRAVLEAYLGIRQRRRV